MQILNHTRGTLLATDAIIANTIVSATIGLLKHKNLPEGEGLVIENCRSIHMFFMKFAIDVVFVDRNKNVVGLVNNIRPFQVSPYFWRASAAIELPSGMIEKTKTHLGDLIFYA